MAVAPQVLFEYWVAATRPAGTVNGLGLHPADAAEDLADFELSFTVLPDPPDLYRRWKSLVVGRGISGKPAHDARIAAAMLAHGLTRLVTLNPADFARFIGDGIRCTSPAELLKEP